MRNDTVLYLDKNDLIFCKNKLSIEKIGIECFNKEVYDLILKNSLIIYIDGIKSKILKSRYFYKKEIL